MMLAATPSPSGKPGELQNPVELVEVGEADVGRLLRGRRPLWIDVNRDGVVVFGRPLPELKARRSA